MPEPVLCKICQKRRPQRDCPAVHGLICSICCGTEREVSLSCPLECEYLQQAHQREKPVPVPEREISHPDVIVTEEFIRDHEELLLFSVYSLTQAAVRTDGANDVDIMTALDAMIQTHRTLESGLVYQTRPENSIAASVQRLFTASLADYNKLRQEREGLSEIRNSELLAILVFLHRIGQQNQNGRARGRMYLDLLRHMIPDEERVSEPASRIII
jgi:hypothetical protein